MGAHLSTGRAKISGDVVYFTGIVIARVSGAAVGISGQNVYFVNDGVNNVVQISGQTVNANVNIGISGTIVYLPNDGINNMVGLVQPARITIANPFTGNDTLPGQYGTVDNQGTTAYTLPVTAQLTAYDVVTDTYARIRVTASGDGFRLITSVSGQPIQISGQSVYLISGKNIVQISGQTVYHVSGSNTVQISGQPVYLISGQNDVQISGQSIRTISGSVMQISGQAVRIFDSNAAVINITNVSDTLGTGVNQLVCASIVYGFVPGASTVTRFRMTTSGDGNRLITSISGQPISLAGTSVVATPSQAIAALSGGTVLTSQACKAAILRPISGNAVMYVGGTGASAPYSGQGLAVYSTDPPLRMNVTNFNQIAVFATISGQIMTVVGEN